MRTYILSGVRNEPGVQQKLTQEYYEKSSQKWMFWDQISNEYAV